MQKVTLRLILCGMMFLGIVFPAKSMEDDSSTHTNPLAIVQYSGNETYRLFDLDGEPFGPTISWEIDWPEGGNPSIRNKIKEDIIGMLDLKIPDGKTVDNVTPDELFQETAKRYEEEYGGIKTPAQYEEEVSDVFWCDGEDCEATIEIWDDALVNITTLSTPNVMNGTPYPETLNELILLETGESWDPSLLPSDSQLLPLVVKQWVKLGYPQEAVSKAGKELLEADSRYWTKDGLTFFYWKPWNLDIPDIDWMVEVTIPYRELLPVLSSDARRFIMPSILEGAQHSSKKDISDKLIYSLFFVEKGEWQYNEGLQKKFKQYGITGPLSYSIFSEDLRDLGNMAQKTYKEWQMRNPDEQDYVDLDFPDTESNVLKSYFNDTDGGSPFDITIMEIKMMSNSRAEVILLCDDSELMWGDKEEGFKSAWVDGDDSTQETVKIYLVKENEQWKVDNVIREYSYDGDIQTIDWKKDLKSFISDPTEFMPYYGM